MKGRRKLILVMATLTSFAQTDYLQCSTFVAAHACRGVLNTSMV